MPRLCESLKHQALVQLRSGVSTRKVALTWNELVFSSSSEGEISGEIKNQRGGCPKVLGEQEKRLGVHLVTTGRLKTASAAAKQLREKTGKHFSDITLCHGHVPGKQLRKILEGFRSFWKLLEVLGSFWKFLEASGSSWKFLEVLGSSLKFLEVSRRS